MKEQRRKRTTCKTVLSTVSTATASPPSPRRPGTLPQYWTIEGKPLLFYTLQVFEGVAWLDSVVVPVAEDMIAMVQGWMHDWHFQKPTIVQAGATRHR